MTEESTALVASEDRIPALARPRLPYHPAIEERFGVDRGTWKVLTDNIFPTAAAPESIIAVLSYCRARKLDVLKKPVHIVQVWDKKSGSMVDTFWPSINELRTTAMRTGEYVGKEATEFGPLKSMKLGEVEMEFPEWAQTTVYRYVKGQRCAFVGEKVLWLEYYAKVKRGVKTPNDMWQTKPHSQISKCSEASALRTAFPEELGSQSTSEEMEGQEVDQIVPIDNGVTSGVSSRLSGPSGAQGFTQGHIEAETGEDKPKRTRRTKAEMEAARFQDARDQGVYDHYQDQLKGVQEDRARVMDGKGNITPEGEEEYERVFNPPTETASAPTAEAEPDTSDSAEDASPASETETPGPTEEEGDEAEFEDASAPPLEPEFEAYIDQIEAKDIDWVGVKKAMAEFYNKDLFKGWPLWRQNKVRAITWETITDNKVTGIPDHAQDVSAFRLWIEACDDKDAITGTFAVLKREPAYDSKDDKFKQAMETNVENRLQAL